MKNICLGVVAAFLSSSAIMAQSQPGTRVAFGSCNLQRFDQNHWTQIQQATPQAWIWLGDTIYADLLSPKRREAEYQVLLDGPYGQFAKTVSVFGTWDDHDYWRNNSDHSYKKKAISQGLFLNFLGIPKDSPRRLQEGVYSSSIVGPPGQRVKIVLMDLRYFRNLESQDILGQEQWTWLKQELTTADADLIILGSSHQVLNAESKAETWNLFPDEKLKLLKLINESAAPVVIISGDRHYAELQKVNLPRGFDLIEFTSSGLTHARKTKEINPNRIAAFFNQRNFGLLNIDWSTRTLTAEVHILEDGSVPFRLPIRF